MNNNRRQNQIASVTDVSGESDDAIITKERGTIKSGRNTRNKNPKEALVPSIILFIKNPLFKNKTHKIEIFID
jgi:hypothetical protein